MNRNESFPAIIVSTLAVHLSWASLDVSVEDVDQIQVMVSGADGDVQDLRMNCADNKLTIEQPGYGINLKNLGAERWMQILLRLPRSWKGAVELSTITAPLKARGLTGTDLALDTISGSLSAADFTSITTALHTVSGDIQATSLTGEKLSVRTVSGDASIVDVAFDSYRVNTVSGQIDLDMTRPFLRMDALSVSGDMRLFAPIDRADAALRSVSGRLHTRGVSIQPEGAPVRVSSVSGNLEINCSTAATYEEE